MATEESYSEPPKDGTMSKEQDPSSPASTSSKEDTRDAREQLKKTRIDTKSQNGSTVPPSLQTETIDAESENTGARGRPSKKRSFEDLAKDNVESDPANSELPEPKRSDHKRVRSVDQKSQIAGDISQEETDMDAQSAPGGPGVLIEAPSKEEMATASDTQPQSTTSIPPSSGFANASAASPFGTKSPTKEQAEPQTT